MFIKCHEISTNLATCWNHPQIWEISGLWCPKFNPSCSSQSIQKTPLSLTPTCHTQTNMVMDVMDVMDDKWMKNGQHSKISIHIVFLHLSAICCQHSTPIILMIFWSIDARETSGKAAWSHDLFYPKKEYNSYPLLNIKSNLIALYIHIETYPIISESQKISKHLSTGGGSSPFKLGLPCLTLVKTWE